MNQRWVGRSLPLNEWTGAQVFAALFGQESIATLLESPYPPSPDYPQLGRFSICGGRPRQDEQGKAALWTPSVGEILPFLRSRLSKFSSEFSPSDLPEHLPFIGGDLGWLGYDLAWEIEQLPIENIDALPFPVAYWYEPEQFAVLDHDAQQLWIAATQTEDLDRMSDRLARELSTVRSVPTAQADAQMPLPTIQFVTEQWDYEQAIGAAKEYIRRGDIFQTNLSLRFSAQTQASSWNIYQALHQINPSPFASYWRSPFGDVVSCSPERLVTLGLDRVADTRPIAGTRPRGQTPEQDALFAEELRSNAKEQAEHIMLVDLERNDLGRVCEFGSVEVDELLAIEHYSHVMHLVSNVRGKLRAEFDGIDLIRATFPGGTITGCPKVRCMEIIEELEPVRRSLFYGSCGYLDRRGRLDLNILIRTLLYCPNSDGNSATVWGQVGAGIVADSEPEREWLESLQKAKAQLRALAEVGVRS